MNSRYRSMFVGLQGVLVLSFAISIAQTAALFPIALFINDIFSVYLPSKDTFGLFKSVLLVLALYVFQALLSLWNRHVSLSASKKIIARLRRSLADRLFGLSRSTFISLDQSRVHHGIVQDTERVDIMVNALITTFIPSGMVIIGLFGLLFYLDWVLSLATIPLVVVLFLMARFAGTRARSLVRRFRDDFETFSGSILRALHAMDLIVSSAMEETERKACVDKIEDLRKHSGWMAWFLSAYAKAQESIVLAFGVMVLGLGGWLVIQEQMTLGTLMSFYVVLVFLKSHFSVLIPAYTQMLEGYESFRNLDTILPAQDPRPRSSLIMKKQKLVGPIRLEGVTFGYKDVDVLRQADMVLSPNQVALVMGPSGSGKSTLCRLLMGLHPVIDGRIMIQDDPLESLDLAHFRRQIGVVMQDPVFFPGSLAENIAYGTVDVDLSRIEDAARAASLHDTIMRLPDGYDSLIGERGVYLSGGQRQRLALARAFVREPELFIFDEPTNHLDLAVVQHFIIHVQRLKATTMVLIVSHDPRLIELADRTYDIVEGTLISRTRSIQERLLA